PLGYEDVPVMVARGGLCSLVFPRRTGSGNRSISRSYAPAPCAGAAGPLALGIMTSPYTLVFDLDGTLVDTAPDLITALNHVLTREGLPPVPLNKARNMIGAGARKLLERG